MKDSFNKKIRIVREYSLPLLFGVFLALAWKNIEPHSYEYVMETPFLTLFGEEINLHYFVNDIFMVFFFATAGIELVHSLSPGGALHPIKVAVSPLLATAGGVLGPVAVFFILNALIGEPDFVRGWGICTATDIALAWLIARIVFGAHHPAVKFLLLLAVADDGVGLMIIAIFYPDPIHPTHYQFLILVAVGMLFAFALNRLKVNSWPVYIVGPGLISWLGLHFANMHPALALVFIVPFLPKMKHGERLDHSAAWDIHSAGVHRRDNSPLARCENQLSPFIDFGLLFFGLTNAGVEFSRISNLTWIICISLILGKTLGIFIMGKGASLLGFRLPAGMRSKELLIAGLVGGMGLTVALFVAESAFTIPIFKDPAKMGAMFSGAVFILAPIIGRLAKVKRITTAAEAKKLIKKI